MAGGLAGLGTSFLEHALKGEYDRWRIRREEKRNTRSIIKEDLRTALAKICEDWDEYKGTNTPYYNLRQDMVVSINGARGIIRDNDKFLDEQIVSQASQALSDLLGLCREKQGACDMDWSISIETEWEVRCRILKELCDRLK